MSNGARVAAAVGAGYVLGRTRKMRLAFMLAAAGVTGKFPARPTDLMVQGLKSLGASEQFNELGDQLRGELLGAARAAAVAAATSQVDTLNDRLQGVTSQVGTDKTLESVGGTADKVSGRAAGSLGRRRKTAPEPDDSDEYDENGESFEDLDDEVDDVDDVDDVEDLSEDDVDEPEPPVRRRSTMRQASPAKTATRRSARAEAHDEPRARAARQRSTAAGAPVRRGRSAR